MNIIKITHWCPRCRVAQEDWRVPNTTDKTVFRRGDTWDKDNTAVYDKCESCGTDIHGCIIVGMNDKEQWEIKGVEELGFRS